MVRNDPPTTGQPGRLGLFLATAVVALGLDLTSKVLLVAELDPLQPTRLFGGTVYLVLSRTGGAAVSVAGLVRVAGRLRSVGWALALGLILGGAVGNLVDRLARWPGFGRGHVVDWISLFADDGHIWPIFNLADAAIVTGGVLGAIMAARGVEFDGRRPRSATAAGPDRTMIRR